MPINYGEHAFQFSLFPAIEASGFSCELCWRDGKFIIPTYLSKLSMTSAEFECPGCGMLFIVREGQNLPSFARHRGDETLYALH